MMPITISGSTGVAGVDGSASTPAFQGTDTNTGIYFPGADRIGLAEGGVQVGEFDASGNLKFNSGYGSVATAYGCRAWVNFNGTTASPSTIRGSANVTSVTKNTTGDYTVNFTSAMPDANYCVAGTAGYTQGGSSSSVGYLSLKGNTSLSTGSVSVITTYQNGTTQDDGTVCVAIFR